MYVYIYIYIYIYYILVCAISSIGRSLGLSLHLSRCLSLSHSLSLSDFLNLSLCLSLPLSASRAVLLSPSLSIFFSLACLQCFKQLTPVGFEPTQLALVELESTPLDHSGKVSILFNFGHRRPHHFHLFHTHAPTP